MQKSRRATLVLLSFASLPIGTAASTPGCDAEGGECVGPELEESGLLQLNAAGASTISKAHGYCCWEGDECGHHRSCVGPGHFCAEEHTCSEQCHGKVFCADPPVDAPTEAPDDSPRGDCCWGGDSCADKSGCVGPDHFCGSENKCNNECNGKLFCPAPPPTPAPPGSGRCCYEGDSCGNAKSCNPLGHPCGASADECLQHCAGRVFCPKPAIRPCDRNDPPKRCEGCSGTVCLSCKQENDVSCCAEDKCEGLSGVQFDQCLLEKAPECCEEEEVAPWLPVCQKQETTTEEPQEPSGECCYAGTSCEDKGHCNPLGHWCGLNKGRCMTQCAGKVFCPK